MISLSLPVGFIDLKGLLGRRNKEEALFATQKMYSNATVGNTEELIGGLRAPESADIPLEIPEQAVEVADPLWKIWHTDPANHIMLAIAIILLAGKLGAEVARRLGAPEVTGELIMGMFLGNVWLFSGWRFFDFLREMHFLEILADFGAVILLLTVGLHTDLRAMLRVGLSSFLVAVGGIVAPAGLGFLVGHFMLPEAPLETKLFLGITLSATSVAITLRVMDELKMLNTTEARIVLGAAILDDVIVLMLLGMVSGIALSGRISFIGLGITGGISLMFLFAVCIASLRYNLAFGDFVTKRLPEGLKIAIVAVTCLVLAFLAESIGLHTILGAFGAGLLLQHVRLIDFEYKEHNIDWIVRVASWILVPILFVRVGAQVELESFFNLKVVLIGLAITGAAILGKLFCSVCIVERGLNRLAIGIGMAARLEVTLIIAAIGKELGVLSDALFASIVVMTVLVALISPPLLKIVLLRQKKGLVPLKSPIPCVSEDTRKVKERLKRLGRG